MIVLRLTEMLAKRGKTYNWLRETTGLDHSSLSRLRNGKAKSMTWEQMDSICAALNCKIGDILVYVPEEKGERKPAD